MVSKTVSRAGAFPQLGIKAPVVTVAVENITLVGLQTIDNVVLNEDDRVLLINQSIPSENGIYNAGTISWERAPDWNNDGEVTSGVMIANTGRSAMYIASFTGYYIVDTTVVTFATIYGTVGIAASNIQTYNPGFGLTYVSATSFTIDGINAERLYYVGRRLRLVGANGLSYHGTIATSVFGTDTTITMTMEGTDIVPVDIISAVMVSSDVQWTPVAINHHPFRAMAKAKIVSGRIGAEDWWVIVGSGGFIATSNDLGASWTERTITGGLTTEDINDITYDPDNQRFMAVADGTYIITSSDGIAWVSSIPSDLTTATTSGDGVLGHIAFGNTIALANRGFTILGSFSSETNSDIYFTTDNGATWTLGYANLTNTVGARVFRFNAVGGGTAEKYFVGRTSSTVSITSTAAAPWTVATEDSGAATTEDIVFIATGNWAFTVQSGNEAGQVRRGATGGTGTWADSEARGATFGITPLLCITHSILLGRWVIGGENGIMGYSDLASFDNWFVVANGFNPTARILDVHYDENDAIFIAISNDGVICRSTNGGN